MALYQALRAGSSSYLKYFSGKLLQGFDLARKQNIESAYKILAGFLRCFFAARKKKQA